MKKNKTAFFCAQCGYESSKWLGRCPGCESWNTMTEEILQEPKSINSKSQLAASKRLNEISAMEGSRQSTGIGEIDRVLGGGLVRGSLILIGGEPGIGKSTVIMQMAAKLNRQRILYVSGEESAAQIKIRSDRLECDGDNIFLLAETDLESIENVIRKEKPDVVMIDSIQTIFSNALSSAPGTVSQVREVTGELMRLTKETGITTLIVGHVTKEGTIAGPRVLEHMVDTVLYFEGERHMSYRILRAVKNRFGSTNEIGVFEMTAAGLVQILNPSEIMLSGRPENAQGSVVVSTMEGTRPMLLEIQALLSASGLAMPRRTTNGVDANRVSLLMAVLDKRVGLKVNFMDAYVNVLGGLKITEPACDLGIVCAIASSFREKAVDNKTVFIGEVGLTGEIRSVSHIDKRINEAARMGFDKCVIPKGNMAGRDLTADISIFEFHKVEKVLEHLF